LGKVVRLKTFHYFSTPESLSAVLRVEGVVVHRQSIHHVGEVSRCEAFAEVCKRGQSKSTGMAKKYEATVLTVI